MTVTGMFAVGRGLPGTMKTLLAALARLAAVLVPVPVPVPVPVRASARARRAERR